MAKKKQSVSDYRAEARLRIGKRLRRMREDAGLSLADMSRLSRLSKSCLCDVEAGRRNVNFLNMLLISAALGVSIAVFE